MLGVGVRGGGWCVAAVVLVGVLWPAVCGIPRNSLSRMFSNGTGSTWWTRGNTGSWQPQNLWRPTGRLPLKVRITAARLKDPSLRQSFPHPDSYSVETSPTWTETGTGPGSYPTCGVSIIHSNRGHNQVGWLPNKRHRGPVTVRPWSISSNGRDNITIIERGIPNSNSYFIYFAKNDVPISPFHDIPLFANEGNKTFNMVVEVPRWTNAKMEIATKEPLNPIKQDVKKGKLRFVANVFPHHGYIWNYGALPQTWEDPGHMDEATGCKGDNDPIDICEIGYRVAKRGEVLQVKILGVIGLVDEGETDWKLIAIDVNDPLAPQLSDISDIEKHKPGYLKATVEWFRTYKIPDGKPENQFAFDGNPKDREFAHKVIMETHEYWQQLVEGKSDAGGLNIGCVTVPTAVSKLSTVEAEKVVSSSPEPGPNQAVSSKVDLWHFLTLK